MENYLDFVQHKSERAVHTDSITVSVDDLNPNLYSFQRDIVRWALAKGRAAIFADCGLGIELKDSYFAQATKNLESAESTADTEGVDTRVRLRCPNCGVKVTDGKICPICGIDLMAKEE